MILLLTPVIFKLGGYDLAQSGILVFGANGWFGQKIVKRLNCKGTKARIKTHADIRAEVDHFAPEVIINAIGKKAGGNSSNIDGCLDEKGKTMFTNITIPAMMASVAAQKGIRLVHISTGCLWSGYPPERPEGRLDSDPPEPNSFYSETKVQGELVIRSQLNDYLILRPRMPFDVEPHSGNLISKLLAFQGGQLIDAPNSITWVGDFIDVMRSFINHGVVGTFNVTNPEPVRHIQILDWCHEAGLIEKPDVRLVSPDEFHARNITRDGRSNCVLSTDKLKLALKSCAAPPMTPTEVALKWCISRYKRSL